MRGENDATRPADEIDSGRWRAWRHAGFFLCTGRAVSTLLGMCVCILIWALEATFVRQVRLAERARSRGSSGRESPCKVGNAVCIEMEVLLRLLHRGAYTCTMTFLRSKSGFYERCSCEAADAACDGIDRSDVSGSLSHLSSKWNGLSSGTGLT